MNTTSIMTAIKGLVEDGLAEDVFGFLASPYADFDVTADQELAGTVVGVSTDDNTIRLILCNRVSRVIDAEVTFNNVPAVVIAQTVVSLLTRKA